MKENADLTSWRARMIRRHHRVGWCSLLLFVTWGMTLDAFHGFKIGFYLDPTLDSPRALLDADAYFNVRRFLWMLCHRHGTLLALVHLAFAFALRLELLTPAPPIRLAGYFLINAIVLMPAGFFLGGLNPTEADPGFGIWLVPVGAAFLFVAVLLVAFQSLRRPAQLTPHEPATASSPAPEIPPRRPR